ncbi:MAG: alpha/beta hydrolase, partial [Chlorobi bacterium]|nr:alpha/beta hydrolase [Chlorobiota bacterium]
EKLYLDVYTPAGDKETNRPAILWVHGGGFRVGDKTQGYIVTLANEFAKRGYVSISTDYRLRDNPKEDMEGTLNDAVNDVMMALSWVRENSEKYGINKNYIATIGGGSAGGILSTNLCYKDATRDEEWDKSGVVAFINLWGSPNKENMDKVIDKNDPPTLFIHGMADSIVPFSNCEWLVNALDSAGVRFSVFPIPGAGHTPVDHIDDIVERIQKFLYGILSGN